MMVDRRNLLGSSRRTRSPTPAAGRCMQIPAGNPDSVVRVPDRFLGHVTAAAAAAAIAVAVVRIAASGEDPAQGRQQADQRGAETGGTASRGSAVRCLQCHRFLVSQSSARSADGCCLTVSVVEGFAPGRVSGAGAAVPGMAARLHDCSACWDEYGSLRALTPRPAPALVGLAPPPGGRTNDCGTCSCPTGAPAVAGRGGVSRPKVTRAAGSADSLGMAIVLSRRAGAVVCAVGLWLLAPQAPASAHSSGQLPHATLSAEGRVVTIELTGAADDMASIGVALGLLPATTVDAYIGTGPFEDIPTPTQIGHLSRSPALRDYLLSHIQVRQNGRVCDGTAEPASDFVNQGARLSFTCPEVIDQVRLRITVLHDQDRAYATYAVDGTDWYALHTSRLPEHVWDAAAAREYRETWAAGGSSQDMGPVVGIGAALFGVAALGGAGIGLRQVRARRLDRPDRLRPGRRTA